MLSSHHPRGGVQTASGEGLEDLNCHLKNLPSEDLSSTAALKMYEGSELIHGGQKIIEITLPSASKGPRFLCACSVTFDSLDPLDCSPPGSAVLGIFQARILEWVAISNPRVSSQPRDRTGVPCIGRQILYHRAIWGFPFLAKEHVICRDRKRH